MRTLIFRTVAPYLSSLMILFSVFVCCAATTNRAAASSAD
jgi:hypothetical protein